jgi:hypothetical protein
MKIYADDIDITLSAGGIAWQSAIAGLAVTLNFEVVKLDAKHTKIYLPQEGSIIRLVTNIEVFRGIVLTVDGGSPNSNKYTAVDFGFYLNKNEETYQFTDASANSAISKICSDFDIPVDSICGIPFVFSKIYLDKSSADIIWDILEQASPVTGYVYNFDVTPQGLRIYRLGDLQAAPYFRLSENTAPYNSVDLRGNVSHSVSIEDLKNSVKVISGDEKGFVHLTTAQNSELITKYGLLQKVEKLDEKETANAAFIAAQRLRELSKKKETFSFEIIESADSYTRAGYEIEVDGAKFIIEGTAHSIKNGIHYVKLDLRKAIVY